MKKNNFKKIFVVFSLCVFLLSMFSVSSFALNISDVHTGYLYKFEGSVPPPHENYAESPINVKGYLVSKDSGDMTYFSSLSYGTTHSSNPSGTFYRLSAVTEGGSVSVTSSSGSFSSYDIYIDYSDNSMSKTQVETIFSGLWSYTVSKLDSVKPMFDKASIALNGGTNSEGVAYDGLLGMVAKFGKFLVSTPLLLVLCIALPLVSFSVGLIIRIKNRA